MDDPKEKPIVEYHEESTRSEAQSSKSRDGVVLIPRPSDDPRDPLNWPQQKKYLTLFIFSLSAFGGTASSLVNQLGFKVQAELYEKSLVEMSYSVCS